MGTKKYELLMDLNDKPNIELHFKKGDIFFLNGEYYYPEKINLLVGYSKIFVETNPLIFKENGQTNQTYKSGGDSLAKNMEKYDMNNFKTK